jgi:hypothetical protein
MAAMTCVSLHGGAGFSYARETRSIAAGLLFCVDEADCMTVPSDHNSSSKEISLSRSDLIRELVAASRTLSAEGGVDVFGHVSARGPQARCWWHQARRRLLGRMYSNLSGRPAHSADLGDTRGQTAGGFAVLIFGVGDYSVNIGRCGEVIGAPDPRYAVLAAPDANGHRERHWNDQFHCALASIANVCRAYGLRAIDGPYANHGDPTGFRAGAERAAALGCEGKWASTPRRSRWRTRYLYRLRRDSPGLKASSVPLRRQPKPALAAFSRDGVLIDMALEKIARSLCQADTPTLQTGATHAG